MLDLSSLPESPGVYVFKDKDGRVLYVGKAKNIRDRVRSYFRNGIKDLKTLNLVKKICHVDPIVTFNEKEAFLLENNLIKEYSPPYNINLRDDKTYISLKITIKEEFPGLYITRKIEDDGSVYFGPYPHAKDVREILRTIQKVFPVRRCKNTVFKKRSRPCVLYEIKKCVGPCTGKLSRDEYMEVIQGIIDFLSGKEDHLLKELQRKIENCANNWQFEEAQALKEKYLAIKEMVEKQNVHTHLGKSKDVWGFIYSTGLLQAVVLNFRRGVLIGKKLYKKRVFGDFDEDEILSLLFQYYSIKPIPEEIYLSERLERLAPLEEYLKEKAKTHVPIYGPKSKGAKELLALAMENIHTYDQTPLDLAFMRHLHLKRKPRRIEIYDSSHLFGSSPSASMVVFEDFKMKKEDYRVFHIKEANPMDDIGSLKEVLTRRLKDQKLGPLPDLFVVDGGRAHLASLEKILRDLNVSSDIIGIAKGRRRRKLEDLIYLPNRKNPLYLPKSSPVYKELLRMRDEAHRFAVHSHRKRKRKDAYR
jgi:excinuclease ABC subunit C